MQRPTPRYSVTGLAARLVVVLLFGVSASSCSSLYYKTMDVFGYAKRDLLVEFVADARDSQEEAKVQFQSALQEFSALTSFEGGDLEAVYTKLNGEFEESEDRAETVRERIADVEDVAGRLFAEWEEELEQYTSPDLRRRSQEKLSATRARYDDLVSAMHKAEGKMKPVLDAFRDRVLFLKHNLNAAAIQSLGDELGEVETDVAALVRDMENSVEEANRFIDELNTGDPAEPQTPEA